MRLTALWLCGTLLALTSLSWTASNSGVGDILGDEGFGPCDATLRLEEPCRQGQGRNTCPYLFSLPPLTVHLPRQLRELEEIVKDLQMLKDNVDELRKMCADCTVSQSERECGRDSGNEREKLNEGADRRGDEKKWMDERDPGKRKDCGADRVKVDKAVEGDGDSGAASGSTLDEKERKQWDAEQRGERGVIKEKEKEKDKPLKDGIKQTDGTKGKDKPGQTGVPTAGENEKAVDMARERDSENNNREGDEDSNKGKDGKGDLKGDPGDTLDNRQERTMTISIKNTDKTPERNHDVRRDETKTTKKKTQSLEDRGSDGMKMSEERDGHRNKERKQHREETKEEMEKGMKAEQNNETPKQAENGEGGPKGDTMKEREADEVDRETGKTIRTQDETTVQGVQRDSDGGRASSKTTERTDFISISPTAPPSVGLDSSYGSLDPDEAATFASSIPSPNVPSSPSYLITDANQHAIMTASGLPTQSTGAAGVSENPDGAGTTDAGNAVGGPGQQTARATIRSIPTTSVRPGAGSEDQVTTATASPNLYTTTLPEVTGRSGYDTGPNSKAEVNPQPDRRPKPDKKPKTGIKPKVDQGQKNWKNYSKPDRTPSPDEKPKHEQKQKNQKPTTGQKPKPGKNTKYVQISKPDRRTSINDSSTDQNLTNNLIPKPDQGRPTDKNKLANQKPNSHQESIPPVQRPTAQIPVNVEAASPDTDPLTGETPFTNPNLKPDNRLHPPPNPNKSGKPGRGPTSKENIKPDQRTEPNQKIARVQESESERKETTQIPTKPKLNPDENPLSQPKSKQHSTPGRPRTPERTVPPPDHRNPNLNQNPKPGQKSKLNLKHPGLVTDPNMKPKPGKTTQTDQRAKAPPADLRPDPNPETVPQKIPEAESTKTGQTRPPPTQRPPTTSVRKPVATPLQRPKPEVQPKPSPKTKPGLGHLQVSVTTSKTNQDSETDPPPVSGAEEQSDVTHSPELSQSTMETVPLGPKTSPSPNTRSLTMSPNSRIPSDTRPKAAGQPAPIPATTNPNNVFSNTSPGTTKPQLSDKTDSDSQPTILRSVDGTASEQIPDLRRTRFPAPSPSPRTTSAVSPASRSTTPPKAGPRFPDLEASTPSARELRVKINQVAARLNGSLGLNERQLDGGPRKTPEDDQGRSRPDTNPPTLTSAQVPTPRDCSDHLLQGETRSGVYLVTPDPRSKSFPVLCDMVLGGGGWTVIQRRHDGSVSFNRTWAEYRSGFGELDGGEFWLGNHRIHLLTRDRDMALRVELQDFNGAVRFAQYEQFRVAGERLRFRLTVGGYSGDAGDALRFSTTYDHNHRAFTTPDRDHDRYPSGNCGAYYGSGWWFDACMAANLNGRYYVKRYKGIRNGIFWGTWPNISTEYYPTNYRQSFRSVRMMVRPKGFAP